MAEKHGGIGNMKERCLAVLMSVFMLFSSVPVNAAGQAGTDTVLSEQTNAGQEEAAQ